MEHRKNNEIRTSIDILYEDDQCVVFDKPAGLLVIPTDKNERYTMLSIVNEQRKGSIQYYPAHRLDRDTSGVILFSKGKNNQQILMDAFKNRKVKKTYLAFVHGRLKQKKGQIAFSIKDFYQRKFQKNIPAQSALTLYEVLEFRKQFSVVQVYPITGRTNQIRIHFSKLGHPLVGEDRYAFRRDFDLKFRRTALHAQELSWPHPVTSKVITVKSPIPKDMTNFLEKD